MTAFTTHLTPAHTDTARFWALIPCAGFGARSGAIGPKQYQPIAGQPMVMHTLAAFAKVARLAGTLVGRSDDTTGARLHETQRDRAELKLGDSVFLEWLEALENDVGTKALDLETPLRIEVPEPVERGCCQQMDRRTVEKRPRWEREIGDGLPVVEAFDIRPVLFGIRRPGSGH